MLLSKEKETNQSVKIKSVQANSLYAVNNFKDDGKETTRKPYLDLGDGVINDSLFAEYMRHHGMVVTNRGTSKDFVVMKFDYGVKGVMSANQLRKYYYENGATITWKIYDKEGNVKVETPIKYKMLYRNTGKAKEGDCTFVKKSLYDVALKYLTMNLWDEMPMDNAKIVEMSAYAPLTTATAIDYITIPMKNIFIVKDEDVEALVNAVSVKMYEVPHSKSVIDWDATEDYLNTLGYTFYKKKQKEQPELSFVKKSKNSLMENGICIEDCPTKTVVKNKKECYVDRPKEKVPVKNTLWDGMGLISEELFPKDLGMDGFIYCRNHFFKSCLFRGDIQQCFKDYYGDDYETATRPDMFGNIFKVSDIKVIITENSIKWIKFKELMGETDKKAYKYYRRILKKHGEKFEIVKTAHASKWGKMQRSSYQVNNSYPCVDKEKLTRIAQPSVDYCNSLKISHDAYIKHLKMSSSKRYSINNVLVALDEWNDNFKYTDYFKSKKRTIISDFKNKRLELGKLFQEGDNLTICGNPFALLKKVTGQSKEEYLNDECFETIEGGIQCYTSRFADKERLAAFRSPHNSPNNIVYLVNTYSDEIQRYFPNLGNNVIVVNGIGTDIQCRANGMDMDTDGFYVTNQPDIVDIAEYAYKNYPTIINDIPLCGNNVYKKDMESYAKMDNKISSSQNATGEASNIAQLALSYYYDDGGKSKELEDVFIICSVLAQVSIDGAKREYDINVNSELNRLKYLPCMRLEDGKRYPEFYAKIQRQKKLRNGKKKEVRDEEVRKFNCPMEILAEIIEKNVIDVRKQTEYSMPTYNLNTVFQYKAVSGKKRDSKQYKKVISIVQDYDKKVGGLDETKEDYSENVTRAFEECMNKINKLTINESTMSSLIAYAFANNGDIRDRLLVALYDRDSKKFLKCFKKTNKIPPKNAESLENREVQIFAYEEGHERSVS